MKQEPFVPTAEQQRKVRESLEAVQRRRQALVDDIADDVQGRVEMHERGIEPDSAVGITAEAWFKTKARVKRELAEMGASDRFDECKQRIHVRTASVGDLDEAADQVLAEMSSGAGGDMPDHEIIRRLQVGDEDEAVEAIGSLRPDLNEPTRRHLAKKFREGNETDWRQAMQALIPEEAADDEVDAQYRADQAAYIRSRMEGPLAARLFSERSLSPPGEGSREGEEESDA